MKRLLLSIFVVFWMEFLVMCSTIAYEMRISLCFEYSNFIEFEDIRGYIELENKSQQPFVMDEKSEGNVCHIRVKVSRYNTQEYLRPLTNLITEIVIFPDENKKIFFNLSDIYDMTKQGSYIVQAEVQWNNQCFVSEKRVIEVVRGIEILSSWKMLPGHTDRIATYSLRYIVRNRSEFLYIVAYEEGRMCYGVYNLGSIVRVMKPEINISNDGTIIVKHRSAANNITTSVLKISEEGLKLVDQSFSTSM